MNHKTMIGVLIIFFFLTVSACAKQKQQQPQQSLSADDIVAKMTAQLGLTDKEVNEVKLIIKNYMAQEKQLKLEEKKQLSKVLTGGQMYTWTFLQNETSREKKKNTNL